MLRVIGCITQDHDLRLVALAFIVCLLAANIGTRLLAGVRDHRDRLQRLRIAASVIALSTGIWMTHFIGLLAFRPNLPSNFRLSMGLVSLVLAVIPTTGAILASVLGNGTRRAMIGGGLVFSTGILLMHFAGMRSLLLPGVLHYDLDFVIAAYIVGSGFGIATMMFLGRQAYSLAAIFLTLSVVSIHFLAMGSLSLDWDGGMTVAPLSISKSMLVMATVCGGLLIVALALVGSILDQHVTARIATEAHRLHALADSAFEGLIFERGGQIIDANRAMCTLVGLEKPVLTGAPLGAVIKGAPLRSVPGQPSEHELIRHDGTIRIVEVRWKNGPAPGGHVVGVRDMTREKTAQLQLQRLAQFDQLTGLTNREHFEHQLQKVITQSERASEPGAASFALLYIDLDRFESVYELFGSRASDETLAETARRLTRLMRQTDTVGRLGRDEFAIIQSFADRAADPALLAEHIVAELAVPFEVDGQTIPLSASVGVALYPANGTTAETLIRSAALALRRSKQEGRATWRYFEPSIDLRLHEKRSMERELRLALAEGQFSVHYQSFFDAETLQVSGCEALLRWNHPIRGRVSPADFIPLAEQNGMIVPIGNWVLATACAEAATWAQPLTIAVNLSPAQFAHKGLVVSIAEVLQQTGLAPDRLELEITEGTLIDDIDNASRILKSLKALGVRIAMDDFGTGYSSLSYLRKFRFDKIKIDRSFVSDVDQDPEAEMIIDAIIAMGRGLRLTITAEGVETSQQLAMLRAHGCTYIQGFLLARPCPSDQLDLSSGKPRWLQPGVTPAIAGPQTGRLTAVPVTAQSV